ncbi:hypothetical protein OTU49_007506 [Cherax quadricarinatus]|uniref:Uncharacterized protein n=1 Tax=Cherax quadricarinatus TaxID=27406 RepID=A0AAW0WGP3_CHEQU|nr:uncharacterized protein LOC128699450 isoform X2 [Cherax quadricarinatus]
METPAEVDNKDWCAIWSTIVVSGTIAFIGLSFVLKDIITLGLVLLFIGGGITIVAVCAAVGKCSQNQQKDQDSSQENMDRPPSYRISWRRSFLRRYRRHTSLENEVTEVSHLEDGLPSMGSTSFHNPSTQPSVILMAFQPATATTSHTSLHTDNYVPHSQGNVFPPRSIASTRHSVSLSNIMDPPSYEAAVAIMDETSLRKLRSEISLPSAPLT